MRTTSTRLLIVTGLAASLLSTGCQTAPAIKDQAKFLRDAAETREWFASEVPGLEDQIAGSGGYVIFPEMAQWGFMFSGGRFGRGAVFHPEGDQYGWAAINTGTLGLHAGIRGYKMLMIFEDETVLKRFKDNQLNGSISGMAVLANEGGGGQAPFEQGVAVYQGANVGLMGAVNVGLDFVRYEPLDHPTLGDEEQTAP